MKGFAVFLFRPQGVPAFPAGYGLCILRGDSLNLCPMCGLAIPRITGNHAIGIEKMQIPPFALSPPPGCPHEIQEYDITVS